MFITAKDLAGLNTTEVEYRNAPSVDEQMLLFHSGPLDVAPETIETVKDEGHKQQAIEATTLPATSAGCLDPDEPCQNKGMGEVAPTRARGRRGGIMKKMLPFAAGVAVGALSGYFFGKSQG